MTLNRNLRDTDWIDGGPTVSFERRFNAPIDLVFKVWTDPAHIAQWWGPREFTNPHCKFEPHVGGAVEIDMQGPDGVIFPNRGTVEVIDPPTLITFTLDVFDDRKFVIIATRTTVTFSAAGNQTIVTVDGRSLGYAASAAAHMDGMEPGWTQTLDRLKDYLADLG